MPSNLPSSFASAAAGQNAGRDSRGGRGDTRGGPGGDWSRRDGRSANGTLTFRRPSTTPLGQPSQQLSSADNAVQPPQAETPSAQPLGDEAGPSRYSKEDLLDMYRPQRPTDDPSRLFFPGWNPDSVNGNAGRGWGKSHDTHVPQEPGACWDQNGESAPMGLQDLSVDEKEAFSTEINSPLKPPTTQGKEGQASVNGRKPSLSHALTSPTSATRPGARRRETLESNPFSAGGLASPPATVRTSRDDPAYWFPRKGSEMKNSEAEEATGQSSRDPSSKLPFGNLVRSNTAQSPSAGSVWPPSSQNPAGGVGFGNFALPSSSAVGEKRAGGASGGSRLAHLMPKEGESAGAKGGEGQNPLNQQSWRSRPRTDTDPFGDDGISGSAALGGAQDTGSALPSHAGRVGTLGTPVKGSTGDFGMSSLGLGGEPDDAGPLSPAETNPYRSPPGERYEHEEGERGGGERQTGMGLPDPASAFGALPRGFGGAAFEGSDRSQTSSAGAKGYPLGMPGWPAPAGPSTGTPDRERGNFGGAFGGSLFTQMSDLQSPGLGNLGNVFGPASAGPLGAGSIGRGSSKLGSLFPAAMQAQMQSHDPDNNAAEAGLDPRQSNPLGAIGRNSFPTPTRDTDSPMRLNRGGVFEELFPSQDPGRAYGSFGTSDTSLPSGMGIPQSFTPVSGGSMPFGSAQPGPELPGAQVRQMVMPDRMRWVYLDPQGQVQGPFTGLEMNDWYKANFFTPDLRVKKVEDPEFEPLGQLIRRIGNSREPFLVPQIGVAHGPASQGGPFTPSTTGGVVPPLSGVFPSFGRTLTAEEQNNLERRKQEEQYLMAQQRDFVMRQQAMSKFQVQGQGLQHHSSAHSLQSQPSFGSMNATGSGPPLPMSTVHPPAGYFESAELQHGVAERDNMFQNPDVMNLTTNERQMLASMQAPGAPPMGAGSEEAGLRAGLPDTEQLRQDPEGFRERLMQFESLRAQREAAEAAQAEELAASAEAESMPSMTADQGRQAAPTGKAGRAARKKAMDEAALSLTQQVQQAQAVASQPEEMEMPMPLPPATSSTPLPAPTAQRVRSNLPEQYSRSQSGTPETAATQQPPLAPWAKEHGSDGQRGPSLKEIQEAEARKAARAEETAAAVRKAAMEQEVAILREREKAAAAAAGLPASSTWAHESPVSTAAGAPWSKQGPARPAPGLTNAATAASKKTLADIQREEEVRKQRAREASGQTASPAATSKSYANLAGKPGQPPLPGAPSPAAGAASTAAGWATVGAGGKVKVPTGPASGRSASTAASSARPAAAPAPKPVSRPAGGAHGKGNGSSVAMDEFNKWVGRELSRGITGVNDITVFQAALDVLPLDTGLIADAVYANSTTMDGRHFAEEFVRRKRLAEKGVIVEKQATEGKPGASSSGWSEVAKKGGAAQPPSSSTSSSQAPSQQQGADAGGAMQGAGFKVVPSRKKGRK